MASLILLQVIRAVWTEASAEGELAFRRKGVPRALAFAAVHGPERDRGILMHRVEYAEADLFSEPTSADSGYSDETSVRVLGVLIERLGSGFRVALNLDPFRAKGTLPGHPAPAQAPPHFQLEPGGWGRVRYSLRHPNYDGWWYEDVVANAAVLERFDSRVFLRGAPETELKDMVDLCGHCQE
jgi:hypothetical protein